MKVTPASATRPSSAMPPSRSGYSPHMPAPVNRIAPYPRRFEVNLTAPLTPPSSRVRPWQGPQLAPRRADRTSQATQPCRPLTRPAHRPGQTRQAASQSQVSKAKPQQDRQPTSRSPEHITYSARPKAEPDELHRAPYRVLLA